ncbi:hypothetical protein AAH979_17630 [Plantactinospora sp. ZYX-F-223]|uniref:hypothetical protein n=1 Tax=Plantactinospora sp. ZYX-F-223 TaxID=3144103 RepID=UPI0031FC9E8F
MSDEEFSVRGGVAYIDRDVRSLGSDFRTNRHATWPLARLRVGERELTISSLFGEFRVTRTDLVSKCRLGRVPVLASGFKIVGRDHDEAVIFWAVRASKVLAELQRRGWTVVDAR